MQGTRFIFKIQYITLLNSFAKNRRIKIKTHKKCIIGMNSSTCYCNHCTNNFYVHNCFFLTHYNNSFTCSQMHNQNHSPCSQDFLSLLAVINMLHTFLTLLSSREHQTIDTATNTDKTL